MPRCATVSRATVLADFLAIPADITSNLRTLIAGPDYAVRRHDVAQGTNSIGAYDETAGIPAVAWPNVGATEVVDPTVAKVFISQALVRFFDEAEATPTAANGQKKSGGANNEVTHDGGTTIFAGSSRTVNVPNDVVAGDHVYIDTDGAGANAFETTVQSVSGDTLTLTDNLPAALQLVNFNLNISEVVTLLELPATDYTATSATILVNAAITTTTTRVTTASPVVGGTTPYSVAYVDYRALRPDNVGDVFSITNLSQMDTFFVGWEDPESGLGFAIARALAPQPDPALPDLPAVLGVAVATNDTAGWDDVLSRVARRVDWYTIAPLTNDTTIMASVNSMVASRKTQGLDSRSFLCLQLTETEVVFTGSENIALSGGDLTITATNPIFADAVAGDTVTTDIGDRTIQSVTSNQEVVVTAAATGANTVTAVTHTLTVSEKADDYGLRAQAYGSREVSVIFPPDPTWNGEVVDGFLYAAACAGLRGYAAPQQSLRGVEMDAGWDVPQSGYEFLGELFDLGAYGCFVSEQGSAIILYDNTTDQSATVDRTEAIVANADAVTRYVYDLLACYEGRTKVNNDTLNAIQADVTQAIATLSVTEAGELGPVIESGSVGQPTQDPNNLDTVLVPVTVVLAAGLNTLTISITVELQVV